MVIRTTSLPCCWAAMPSATRTARNGATTISRRLIQKAKVTSDVAERTKLYEDAQVIFKEQAPWATIAHSVVFTPMTKAVQNYVMSPLGTVSFEGVDLTE